MIIDGTPNLRMSTLPVETRQDEAFATHSQERIMGLLGSMIPPKEKVGRLFVSASIEGSVPVDGEANFGMD